MCVPKHRLCKKNGAHCVHGLVYKRIKHTCHRQTGVYECFFSFPSWTGTFYLKINDLSPWMLFTKTSKTGYSWSLSKEFQLYLYARNNMHLHTCTHKTHQSYYCFKRPIVKMACGQSLGKQDHFVHWVCKSVERFHRTKHTAHFNSGWIHSALIIVNVIFIQSISKVGLNYFLCLQLNVCVWMVFQLLQACQSVALLKHKAGLKQTSHPYQSTRLLEGSAGTALLKLKPATHISLHVCWNGSADMALLKHKTGLKQTRPPVSVYMSVGMVLLTWHSSNTKRAWNRPATRTSLHVRWNGSADMALFKP